MVNIFGIELELKLIIVPIIYVLIGIIAFKILKKLVIKDGKY